MWLYKFLVYIFFVILISGNANSKGTKDGPQDALPYVSTGGLTPADPNSPEIKQLARESLNKYLKEIGSYRDHEIQVTNATTQVVAGSLTRINFNAFPTTCILATDMKPMNPPCILIKPSKFLSCYSEIWDRPWLNKKEVQVRCAPRTYKK